MAGQDQAPKAVGQKATVREIEEAREDLARTIDAIADIVSPANVARRTAGKLRQRVQSRCAVSGSQDWPGRWSW